MTSADRAAVVSDTGTRVRLIRVEDAAELSRIVTDSADHLRPWEPTRTPAYFTERGQRRLIEGLLRFHRAGTTVPFIVESEIGEILGRLTLNGVTHGAFDSCSMGYWIRADRLRRGHATRAVAAGVHHAFEDLGLHRVQAETLPENAASQAVLAANGFTRIGAAAQYLRIDGRWRDHLLFQVVNAAPDPMTRA